MSDLLETYKTIEGRNQTEFEEEKSRFITNIAYVESEEEAISFIDDISSIHKDATHNCTAYIINTIPEIKRYSDDGEPSGSAGYPMLSVLEKEEVKNVAVVVTRYFGGKLLGKGGLVRAYSKGVSDGLVGKVVYKKPFYIVELIHSYSNLGIIENYINENKLMVIDKDFTDEVKIKIYVSTDDFNRVKNDLINLTSAEIEIKTINQQMLFTK